MAIKISVINFKGGVGKSTLAFHLATYLAKNKKRVLVIDIDHQSSLSIVILGGGIWEEFAKEGKTSNRIFESFCKSKITMPKDEIIIKHPYKLRYPDNNYYPTLDLVAGQFELDDTEIELASTTIGGPTVSEWEKRTLLASWLDNISVDVNYDYVIFDCPPATKLVSQNALAASDYFVIPVIPDEMSSRGVTHFRNLVTSKIDAKLSYLRTAAGILDEDVPDSYNPVTHLAGIVPFMAKTAGNAASGITNLHTGQIKTLRRKWKNEVLPTVVLNLTGIPESVNAGWPVWDRKGWANVTDNVIQMMENTCQEIIDKMQD